MSPRVTLGGVEYPLSALRVSVLRGQWSRLVSVVGAAFALVRALAGLAKGCMVEESGVLTLDRARLLQELAGDGFGAVVAKALDAVTPEQLDALLDLAWESIRRQSPGLSRADFDELVTVDALPSLVLAFLEAQGIRWGAATGEARPG